MTKINEIPVYETNKLNEIKEGETPLYKSEMTENEIAAINENTFQGPLDIQAIDDAYYLARLGWEDKTEQGWYPQYKNPETKEGAYGLIVTLKFKKRADYLAYKKAKGL